VSETFKAFRCGVQLSTQELSYSIFRQDPEAVQVKKEAVAVRNLTRIVDATLRLANSKGFQAMSLRDLSAQTGLSMGALYAYIRSKEDLVSLIQQHGRLLVGGILRDRLAQVRDPTQRLRVAIRTHLFLSEMMQPWFYFVYMEAKNLPERERRQAVEAELSTEHLFHDIITAGQRDGGFRDIDADLLAACLKAVLQDWYLKRAKYHRRQVSVDAYAAFAEDIVLSYLAPSASRTRPENRTVADQS